MTSGSHHCLHLLLSVVCKRYLLTLRSGLAAKGPNVRRLHPLLVYTCFLSLFLPCSSPVKAKSLACGAGVAVRRLDMTVTERYGADLFRGANACVMLDKAQRFTPTYAPIMERCLLSEGTTDDVDLINSRVMGKSTTRNADTCFDARVIAFRNKVTLRIQLYFLPFDALHTCIAPFQLPVANCMTTFI